MFQLISYKIIVIQAILLAYCVSSNANASPTLDFKILEILTHNSPLVGRSGPSTRYAVGLAVVNGGSQQGLLEGEELTVRRQSYNGLWIQTGTLKIIEVQNDVSLAQITSNSTATAKQMFPRFPQVMASDVASQKPINLVSGVAVLPVMEIPYRDLFIDPNGSPQNYEFSEAGLRLLREIAETYGPTHIKSLIIEGFTDFRGASDQNQIESYQRALSVKGYLINEFGFDDSRIIAIGLGEHETSLDNFAPEVVASHRKLVIRAE